MKKSVSNVLSQRRLAIFRKTSLKVPALMTSICRRRTGTIFMISRWQLEVSSRMSAKVSTILDIYQSAKCWNAVCVLSTGISRFVDAKSLGRAMMSCSTG
jgi:hypothetical protein